MVLGGCGNGADGARADQFNGGSSTGQRQQHGGRPLDWKGTNVLDAVSVRVCSFSLQQFVSSKYVYAVSVLEQFQIDVALFLGYNLCLLVLL